VGVGRVGEERVFGGTEWAVGGGEKVWRDFFGFLEGFGKVVARGWVGIFFGGRFF